MSRSNNHEEYIEIHQVIGDPPHWLLKSGISIVGLFFLLSFIIAWLIKYPDEIESRVVIATKDPPIRVFPKVSGQVERLLITQNQIVNAGDLIAIINNPAAYEDVTSLEELITKAKQSLNPEGIKKQNYKLGGLQVSYSLFNEALEDYIFFNKFNSFQYQIQSLARQIQSLTDLNLSLRRQQDILKQQVDIAQSDLNRNDILFKSNAISSVDLEKVKFNFLQQKKQFESVNTELISILIRIEQLRLQIVELRKSRHEEERKKTLLLQESMSQLESEISFWKQQYLVTAPISGKVLWGKIKSEKQFVEINEEMFIIEPTGNPGPVIARTFIKGSGLGKIRNGMKAIIRLDGYPYQEFGALVGTVELISSVPQDDGYLTEIEIPQDLQTTYNKKLPLIQEMEGTVKIITENRSVAERIFDRLYSIVKNRI